MTRIIFIIAAAAVILLGGCVSDSIDGTTCLERDAVTTKGVCIFYSPLGGEVEKECYINLCPDNYEIFREGEMK